MDVFRGEFGICDFLLLFSVSFTGPLSDIIGRRAGLILCSIITLCGGLLSIWMMQSEKKV